MRMRRTERIVPIRSGVFPQAYNIAPFTPNDAEHEKGLKEAQPGGDYHYAATDERRLSEALVAYYRAVNYAAQRVVGATGLMGRLVRVEANWAAVPVPYEIEPAKRQRGQIPYRYDRPSGASEVQRAVNEVAGTPHATDLIAYPSSLRPTDYLPSTHDSFRVRFARFGTLERVEDDRARLVIVQGALPLATNLDGTLLYPLSQELELGAVACINQGETAAA